MTCLLGGWKYRSGDEEGELGHYGDVEIMVLFRLRPVEHC